MASVESSAVTHTPSWAAMSITSRPGCIPTRPEFKHEIEVALNLLANAPDDDSRAVRGRDLGHRLTRLVHGRAHLLPRLIRKPQLGQARNEIAVRAPDRVIEQVRPRGARRSRISTHVFPSGTPRCVPRLPGQLLDHPDQQAYIAGPVLAHHPGGERPAGIAQREVPVALNMHQAVAACILATVWLTVGPVCPSRSAIRARSGVTPSSSRLEDGAGGTSPWCPFDGGPVRCIQLLIPPASDAMAGESDRPGGKGA